MTSAAPRRRPATPQALFTVDSILEAAERILEHSGPRGLTTNHVAELAGVSIGSLYQYFPNKDALTKGLIERESAMLLADVARLRAHQSGRTAIRKLVNAAVAHQLRRPALARILDFEEARLPIPDHLKRVNQGITDVLVDIFDKADMPLIANPKLAAYDVLAIVKGMVDAAGERGELDASPLEARVTRAVFGYLQIKSAAV
jgi:AcrR family transcriptional regulator